MSVDPNKYIVEDGEDFDLIKDIPNTAPIIGEVIQVTDAIVEDGAINEENKNTNPLQYIKE